MTEINNTYESKIIEDYAQQSYDNFIFYANSRDLQPSFVVGKFLSELYKLAMKDGYIDKQSCF